MVSDVIGLDESNCESVANGCFEIWYNLTSGTGLDEYTLRYWTSVLVTSFARVASDPQGKFTMVIPPNSRQGPQYSWISSPSQEAESFSHWTHRWFPQELCVKQRPDCVEGNLCLGINIAPSARYGHSAVVYETWNFERDVAAHATLCRLSSFSNSECTSSCLTEDFACTGATSWSNFFSTVSDNSFWKSTLLFGSDDGFSEPVADAVSESCPSQCCGERRLCVRSRDNLGQKVPFDESYMLIFGGQTKQKTLVAVDQEEEDLYANCESYLLSVSNVTNYSGCMQFISEELWRYSIKNNVWELLKPVSLEVDGTSVPSGRFGHSAVLVTVQAENDLEKTRRQYMYMFGGFSLSCYTAISSTSICSDLWRYEIPWAAQGYWPTPQGAGKSMRWNTGNSWKRMSNAPLGLYRHSMVASADGNYLIVYGGQISGAYSSDVLVYTVASDTWTVKDVLGYAGFVRSGFTYQGLNVSYSFTKMKDFIPDIDHLIGPVSGGLVPGVRADHCAVFENDQMLVLNGFKTYSSPFPSGTDSYTYYADSDEVWRYSLASNTWSSTYVEKTSPFARKGAACTVLSGINSHLLLLGGSRADSIYKDVWVLEMNRTVWKRQDHLSFMENVTYHSMVYDSSSDQVVVFGGKTWTESDLLASDQKVSNDRSCFMNALNVLLATCSVDDPVVSQEECALSLAKSDIISKCSKSTPQSPAFCCKSVEFFDESIHQTLESLSSLCTNECQAESFTPEYTSNFLQGIHIFSPSRCFNNCSNNGVCEMGACFCRPGWTGSDCSSPLCPGSFCYSDSLTLNNSCVFCSGNGLCSSLGECKCNSGYTGPDCSEIACINNCSGKGFCFPDFPLNQCICNGVQSGDDCSITLCLNDCALSGTCNHADGTCACNPNFYGPDCSVYLFDAFSPNIHFTLVWWTLLILAIV